jgi:dUTP pyrophosphatase
MSDVPHIEPVEFGVWLNQEKYDGKVLMPQRAHNTDAGFDLVAVFPHDEYLILDSQERHLVGTGIHLKLKSGWEAQIRPRSGNALKKGLTVLNTPGTIDAGYTGEIQVILYNASQQSHTIHSGDKIAQMVIKKVPTVILKEMRFKPTSDIRGEKGFGSTGV